MTTHFRIVILVLISAAAAAFIWSVFIEPARLTENIFSKPQWPLAQVKIAFFSDLHAGSPHINKSYINNLVQRINSHSPDIILIGGDLVINGVLGGQQMDIQDLSILLAELKAPLGRYVVLGNHDWWNGGERITAELKKAGFSVLENQANLISLKDNSKFWLIGIGDHYTEHADPQKAFLQTNNEFPKIVFMHDPGAIFGMKEKYFLTFAGHMHGGQIFIPGVGALVTPSTAPKSWAKGWIDFPLGSIYVSQGVGTSILPVRLNAPPEFVILNLQQ